LEVGKQFYNLLNCEKTKQVDIMHNYMN